MAAENPTPATGKQAAGKWLKAKGTAIGVAVGVALTATGDYLCGNSGLLGYLVGLGKQLWTLF